MKQLLITTDTGQRIILNPDYISEISEETPSSVLIQVVNPNYGPPKVNTAYVVNESLASISIRIRDASYWLPTEATELSFRRCCEEVQKFFYSMPDLCTPPGLRSQLDKALEDFNQVTIS